MHKLGSCVCLDGARLLAFVLKFVVNTKKYQMQLTNMGFGK